jgi:hypothetical protein
MWESQLKLHKRVHFLKLKILDNIFLNLFQEIPRAVLCYETSSTNDSRASELQNGSMVHAVYFFFEPSHREGFRKSANTVN